VQLISGFEEEADPMLALLLGDPFSEVVADHSDASTVVGRVLSGAAQHFSDEFGDVLEMGRIHIAEEGFEDRVGRYLLVEARDERLSQALWDTRTWFYHWMKYSSLLSDLLFPPS
jgi:hypothetical protein